MNEKDIKSSIERITRYEEIFDEIAGVTEELKCAAEAFEAVRPKLAELAEYYDGELWMNDYELDESGLLPKELKRGVLSEDAVYDLLEEAEELEKRLFTE